ncbi:MAG: DUF488 family protein [Tissierellia bacterium]|nr:DUF488 family protein [Tissierellia bacterium]
MKKIIVQRVYDKDVQGYRVLVDRLWPRGIKKEEVKFEEWNKDITPSNNLRKDYHDGKISYEDFSRAYEEELDKASELKDFVDRVKDKDLVLLTSVKDVDHSHIPVLINKIEEL